MVILDYPNLSFSLFLFRLTLHCLHISWCAGMISKFDNINHPVLIIIHLFSVKDIYIRWDYKVNRMPIYIFFGKTTFRTTLSLRTPDRCRKDRMFVMKNTGCSVRVIRNVVYPFFCSDFFYQWQLHEIVIVIFLRHQYVHIQEKKKEPVICQCQYMCMRKMIKRECDNS